MIKILAIISLGLLASCSSQMFDGRFDFSEILLSPPTKQAIEKEVPKVISPPVVEIIKETEEKIADESKEAWSWWNTL